MWKGMGHGSTWMLGLDRAIRRYELNFQNGFAFFVGPARGPILAHMGSCGLSWALDKCFF